MKILWTRTDSLMLIDYSMRKVIKRPYWFVFRILIRIIEPFIQCHYCISQNIAENIHKFGVTKPIEIIETRMKHYKKYEKIKHNTFNVIYYNPINSKDVDFTRWLYGLDLIEEVINDMKTINFIELDGTKDLSNIYPITDFMIRPNRHDGPSRIRLECEIQNIPYYWTQKNPNKNDMIKAINYELNNR